MTFFILGHLEASLTPSSGGQDVAATLINAVSIVFSSLAFYNWSWQLFLPNLLGGEMKYLHIVY